MRRPVRPFVKEFKTRSTKPPPRPSADVAPVRADLFEEARTLRHNGRDDAYEAALRAADAVFGKPVPAAAPVVEAIIEAAPPPVATGRVLPSLIESPALPEDRSEEVKKKGKPRAERREARAPVKRRRAPRPAKAEIAPPPQPIELPAAAIETSPEGARRRRAQRPIQARWVFRTELRAGEKWKKRLPEAARRLRSLDSAKKGTRRRGKTFG